MSESKTPVVELFSHLVAPAARRPDSHVMSFGRLPSIFEAWEASVMSMAADLALIDALPGERRALWQRDDDLFAGVDPVVLDRMSADWAPVANAERTGVYARRSVPPAAYVGASVG